VSFCGSDLGLLIEAYREAGNELVESSLTDQSFPHEIAFPISSLYRQYLELNLKQLIYWGNQLIATPHTWNDENSRNAGYPLTHNLNYLFTKGKEILTQLAIEFPSVNFSDLDFAMLQRCIVDYFSVDITEDPFRFTKDKQGNAFFPNGYSVNVYELRETMDRVDVLFFDQVILAISDIRQVQVKN
jgi:hypothetical protein